MNNNAYQLQNIYFTYGGEFALTLKELIIPANEIFCITGYNGSGKTTLLKLLAFLHLPQEGKITYFNQLVTKQNLAKLRSQVSMLFQDTLLLKRPVFENIVYGLKVRGDTEKLPERVKEVLCQVDLPPDKFMFRNYSELSGGEVRRVALASRLILKPEVLLLDEPLTHIDPKSRKIIDETIINFQAEHKTTIILTTHDQKEADKFGFNGIIRRIG